MAQNALNDEEEVEIEAEIVVPHNMKPYINKEINFKMFIDLLMDKVDQQRVFLKLKDFQEIKFGSYGLPLVVLKLFQVLT